MNASTEALTELLADLDTERAELKIKLDAERNYTTRIELSVRLQALQDVTIKGLAIILKHGA